MKKAFKVITNSNFGIFLTVIVLFLLSQKSCAQAVGTRDTIAVIFTLADTTHYYNAYDKKGKLVAKNILFSQWYAKNYKLIQQDYVNKSVFYADGFQILIEEINYNTEIIANLDKNYKPFKPPFIITNLGIPRTGLNF